VAAELRKILRDETLPVDCWSHYTPVFYGHSQVIRLQTEQALTLEALRKCLRKVPGLKLMPGNACLTPVDDGVGGDAVLIGQIRPIAGVDNGFLLWTLSDNVRKSAAVNSVQIAETLLKAHL
jgi:aspartate-semialdehyde dehydrogenase